jgi:hypothetical protein
MEIKQADMIVLSGSNVVINTYEKVALKKLQDPMMMSGARELFFKAFLYKLAYLDD